MAVKVLSQGLQATLNARQKDADTGKFWFGFEAFTAATPSG